MLALPQHDAPLATITELTDHARTYIDSAKAPATLRAYRSDWNDFATWCFRHHRIALPAEPQTVVLYLSDLAQRAKPATIQRRLSSISQAHQAAGHDSPTHHIAVRTTWAGIRRVHGTAQEGKAAAVTDDIKAMCATLPPTLLGTRDRALLLIGFAGAFRRSELVSLDIADLRFSRAGLVITLRRSKTDQEGEGALIGIEHGANKATCPVRSLRAWLDTAGIEAGPIFRPMNRHGQVLDQRLSDKAVARVVKRSAEAAGLDPELYSGHSLRVGLVTSAAQAGVAERDIMKQSRHKSERIMRKYVRDAGVLIDNVSGKVGL